MIVKLRNLFSAQAVAQYLKALPPVHSTVMDNLYPDRPTHPFPLVGAEELLEVLQELPAVTRGGRSVSTSSGSVGVNFYEPLPVKANREITGQDLNNLKMILGNRASITNWARGRVDILRKSVRKTTEAMSAVALTGTLSWPVKLDGGGWQTYEIAFGDPLSVTPDTLLDASTANLSTAYKLLSAMRTEIQNAGVGGGTVEYLAGQSVYAALLTIVENVRTTAKHNIRADISGGVIDVGGFKVRECAETYRNPRTGAITKKIPDIKIVAYATDAPGKIFYCSLDDVDNNLQAMPFLSRVDKLPEGTGVKVIGHSKPLPCRSPKTICWATACSEETASS